MVAFNAVAGLNPFTIIAVAIAVVGALVFLQASSISGQAWNAIWQYGGGSWLPQRSVRSYWSLLAV